MRPRQDDVLLARRQHKCRGSCLVVVFFQAEDGIRDLTVTGVQTCALPICSTTRLRRILFLIWCAAASRIADQSASPAAARTVKSLFANGTPWASSNTATPRPKIGRASCRERG